MAALCESFTLRGPGPGGGGPGLCLEPGPGRDLVLLTERGRAATLFKVPPARARGAAAPARAAPAWRGGVSRAGPGPRCSPHSLSPGLSGPGPAVPGSSPARSRCATCASRCPRSLCSGTRGAPGACSRISPLADILCPQKKNTFLKAPVRALCSARFWAVSSVSAAILQAAGRF